MHATVGSEDVGEGAVIALGSDGEAIVHENHVLAVRCECFLAGVCAAREEEVGRVGENLHVPAVVVIRQRLVVMDGGVDERRRKVARREGRGLSFCSLEVVRRVMRGRRDCARDVQRRQRQHTCGHARRGLRIIAIP